MPPVVRSSLVVALLVMLLTGCAEDGRTLRAADAPPPSATEIVDDGGVPTTALVPLRFTSPLLATGGTLAPDHTCDGAGVPPPVEIIGVPPASAELAITMADVDANGYVHWILAGIAPTVAALPGGVVPDGAVPARSDGNVLGYEPPCPPEGGGPHRYVFRLWVMAEPVGLAPDLLAPQALNVLEASVVSSAEFQVTFER